MITYILKQLPPNPPNYFNPKVYNPQLYSGIKHKILTSVTYIHIYKLCMH